MLSTDENIQTHLRVCKAKNTKHIYGCVKRIILNTPKSIKRFEDQNV